MREFRERSGSDDVSPFIKPIYPTNSEGPALRYARKAVCGIFCQIEIHRFALRRVSLEVAASDAQARIAGFKSDRSPVARSSMLPIWCGRAQRQVATQGSTTSTVAFRGPTAMSSLNAIGGPQYTADRSLARPARQASPV
jgi:hypothetical protein